MDGPRVAGGDPATAIAATVAWIVVAYLCGSIPFGPLVARLRGVDLRRVGSGNVGATNVARALGKPLGILVFLCDAAKGLLPVLLTAAVLGRFISGAAATHDVLGVAAALHGVGGRVGDAVGAGPGPGAAWSAALADHWLLAAAGAAAFLGHITSPFLGFRGGKGVATAFGVFIAIAPLPAALALGVFALTYALTRISSLGSLLAATTFVPALYLMAHPRPGDATLAVFMWVVIVVRHHDNLRRLVRREERTL